MERLSGMDAFFLYLETPNQPMHVTLCAVLDPSTIPAPTSGPAGWSFPLVKRGIAERVHLVPAFRQRLVPVPLRLHHPVWVDDPNFDVDAHVFRAALPSPGGPDELAGFVAQVASVPLDRSRPLWEMWLVEGLTDGGTALVGKVHHAALDGVAGVEQMINFFDLGPEGREIEPPDPANQHVDTMPTEVELIAYATASRLKGVFDVLPLIGRTASGILAVRNRRAGDRDPLASDELNNDDRPARAGTPLICPPTMLNGSISGQRKVAFERVSLDEVKAVGRAAGATVNDVILALCAGTLRRYLLHHDALPAEPLVAACPVNVRTTTPDGATPRAGAGNHVSAMFTLLHTELATAAERLGAASRTAGAAKEEHALFDPTTLQQWAEVADPNLFSWLSDRYAASGLASRHRPALNVMISNLPGPAFPLYLAGAKLERAYPMGQIIEGVGLNITVMSYCDSVDIGFMAAANLLPDVELLAADVAPAMAELVAAFATADP